MLKKKKELALIIGIVCVLLTGITVYATQSATTAENAAVNKKKETSSGNTVSITDLQAKQVKIVPTQTYDFVS
ncbi:hypothetical protein ABTD73_19965, partial [Acinetobacter baumannii]